MSFLSIAKPHRAAAYLINQTFNGPGIDHGESWTIANATWNPAYATSPAPLEGVASLLISSAGTAAPNGFANFTANANVYCRFLFNLQTGANGNTTLVSIRNSTTLLASIGMSNATSNFRSLPAGGSTVTATLPPTLNTTYYGWIEYEKGSGANAICRVGLSLTGARPTWPSSGASGLLAVSINGTSTSNANRIYLGFTSTLNYAVILDQVLVSSTPFP